MTPASSARLILTQAWPIFFGQLAGMAFAVVDTMMTGHASVIDLAAMGLGASVYGSVFMGLLGVVNALNPIIARHVGAGRDSEIGRAYVQGLWLSVLTALVGCPVLASATLWVPWVGAPAEVQAIVARYLAVLALALPAAVAFRAIYALNIAVSRPRVVMLLQLGGLLLKVGLSYVLIFGAFGLPRLGAVGCAVATAIVFWLIFAVAFSLVRFGPSYRRYHVTFAWPDRTALAGQLRLGVPMGLSYLLESSSFTLMAVLVARLGASVMGGHQIVMNLAALTFQIPLAISVATMTVAGQALGADDRRGARLAAFAGLRICLIAAALTSVALWTFRHGIIGLYTTDPVAAAIALSLIVYVIAFHVFDALQAVTAFVLRAYHIAMVPTVIYAVALWGLGLVGGYVVAFYPVLGAPRGAAGLWLMQAVALFVTSLLLLAFYLHVLKRQGAATLQSARAGP